MPLYYWRKERPALEESELYHVHTKFEGYIEKLYVNFTGQLVKQGEPLFSIYSRELLATENEYLLALKAAKRARDSGQEASFGGAELVKSARKRLMLWDIPEDEIKRIERSGEPSKAVRIYSPITGFVINKSAPAGMRIGPADSVYDIVDLRSV